jgi:hypothetical protein
VWLKLQPSSRRWAGWPKDMRYSEMSYCSWLLFDLYIALAQRAQPSCLSNISAIDTLPLLDAAIDSAHSR